MSKPYTDAELQRAARAVLDNFNAPDDRHPTWWINPKVSASAVLDAVAPAIAARALREIAFDLREGTTQNAFGQGAIDGLLLAADVAEERADEIKAGR